MITTVSNSDDTFYNGRSFAKMFIRRNFTSSMLQALVTTFIACHLRDVYLNGAPSTGDIRSLYNLLDASHTPRPEIKMGRHLLGHTSTSRLMLRRCYPLLHKYR